MKIVVKETVIKERIPFRVVVPIKEEKGDEGEPLKFTGLARTTEISLNRNRTTEKCIRKVKKQIRQAADSGHPFPSFIDHESRAVCGNIVGVKPSSAEELWPVTELLTLSGNDVVDAPVQQVITWHENNVQMGMSISGIMTEAIFMEDEDTHDWWFEIDDMDFLENSITNDPAQLATRGTIQFESCKNGFCNQIVEQVIPQIRETHPEVYETVNVTGQEDLSGEDDKLEVSKMDDEIQEKIDKLEGEVSTLSQGVNLLVQRENDRIKKEEEVAKQDEIKKLHEQWEKDFMENKLPEIMDQMVDGAEEVFKEKVGGLLKDRTHKRKSDEIDESNVDETKTDDENKTFGELKKPGVREYSLTDSVNYPPVINGKITNEAYSPEQIVDLIMGS